MATLFQLLASFRACPPQPTKLTGNFHSPKLSYNDSIYAFTGPTKSQLDNWAIALFEINGHLFHTSEHAIFAVSKAGLFQDAESHRVALTTVFDSPRKSKQFGRMIDNFNADIWNTESFWISDLVLLYKVLQNRPSLEELLSTGTRLICEASRSDLVWGIGYDAAAPEALQRKKWRGENRLGESLMRVRSFLQKILVTDSTEIDITTRDNMEMFLKWFP
mmetsp:Transcript_19181/g.32948  ORF Transcript_19181/g.32948 Transcript_19181/m.32948 type:complete len:219 (+) Transcript_19181:54-710(+)|eukprot:CAMPEP_0196653026 /NCGR_PEP_ID=MMETSP1086-20130531/2589_1 /TAXON_ID=77921 /ORGANISM="Cyanoptyche  gloeocystis , Strain SAG4.97" /LENGTH=218 /DNA_ID=CAMNT_0041983973 /DNA_START=96 /DNA_END=752 /DNA_ORIENTATION=-